tara:strand:+ start:3257 stop:4039 length:783 start_codon:yes stop_codon:yes gene_type:complete
MALKKIYKIASSGKVTFLDNKVANKLRSTPSTTDGTKDDCLAYGYKYKNSKCYAFSNLAKRDKKHRNIKSTNITTGVQNSYLGSGNVTEGSKNIIVGNNNKTLNANNNIVIGNGVYTNLDGGITYGSYSTENRARNVFFTYEGSTTNAVATELFSNGDNKLSIDENYEAAYFIKATLVSLNPVSNTCSQHELWSQFRFTNSTLTRTSEVTISAGLGDVALGLELDAVAGTPDYIRVRVTGRASETWYHNIKLDITEIKYA